MKRTVGGALAAVFLMPAIASAHRLDEYLQATRVGVARDHIAIELALTPGVSIASDVIASIDGDGNGEITASEAYAYGRTVLADLVFAVDGRAQPLALTRVDVPAVPSMREGMEAIRIEAVAPAAGVSGRHDLFYRNDHRPDVSVYQVNALMPVAPAIAIAGQRRDARQREFHLHYVLSGSISPIAWGAGAVLGLAVLVISRGRVNVRDRLAG